MGSYWKLSLGKYELMGGKNYIYPPEVMTIFRECDRKILGRGYHKKFFYTATTRIVSERLDCMGFTLDKTRHDFEKNMRYKARENKRINVGYLNDKPERVRYQNYLTELNFKKWRNSMSNIIRSGVPEYKIQDQFYKNKKGGYFHRWVAENYDEGNSFGFLCNDVRFFLKAVISIVSPAEKLILDYSDLVDGGWISSGSQLSKQAFSSLTDEYKINEKILVIPEGSTDARLLEKTMALLYPHLHEYYSFLDFDISNSAGGASTLASLIRGFVGAKIRSKIIAIFDNDAAGYDAVRVLPKRLPSNIKVIKLPILKFAKKYPSIGPQGLRRVNVNGKAVSLELFFGRDVLRDKNGSLRPVQWGGYVDAVNKYQGEVTYKRGLQKLYGKKLERSQKSGSYLRKSDWAEMRLLFSKIIEISKRM